MAHGISGIEHLTLAVADLDRTVGYLRRLGFTVGDGGESATGPMANLLFKTERIELRAGGGDPDIRVEAGLLAADIDQCRAALEARGWTPAEPAGADADTAGRRLVLDEGPPRAEVTFEICAPVAMPADERADRASHANGARALGVVTAVNDDPEALCPWAERLFGESAVVLTDDTLAVFPGHNGFLFVTPDHLNVMFPEFELGDVASGQIAAMSVLVDDIARTAAVLENGNIDFQWGRADGVLHVPHSADLALLLEFTTRDRFGSVPSFFD